MKKLTACVIFYSQISFKIYSTKGSKKKCGEKNYVQKFENLVL